MYIDSKTQKPVFSPSDLTIYMTSPYASWMDRFRLEHPEEASDVDEGDSLLDALARKGLQHEAAQLEIFRREGKSIVEITNINTKKTDSLLRAQQQVRDAMFNGVDVIFQAMLEQVPFRGLADFLVKVPGRSDLGDYHYEVWDTKLSSSVKPAHVVQLCCYADMLQSLQGRRPESVVVALGNGTFSRLRTDNYFYYYRALKARFLQTQFRFNSNKEPDPADYADHGRWSAYAQEVLAQSDYLGSVATIRRSQIKRLNAAGIMTRKQLIDLKNHKVPGMQPEIVERLQTQAKLQQRSESQQKTLFELIPANPDRPDQGLSVLPPHSPLDVFFDIEGYPLEHGGLEYLWGCTYFDDKGKRCFQDFWAHNAAQEKQAFMDFIDWVYARWQQDPAMHIYHYASYEVTACRKLMGRYGVREEEVDQLLRNGVFIDLYTVVKTSLIVGEPRYSIKNIEHLYRPGRVTDVTSGGDSVVAYDKWREAFAAGEEGGNWLTSETLRSLREYNKDDCDSTQELTDWLREQQKKAKIAYAGEKPVIKPPTTGVIDARLKLRDDLLARAQEEYVVEGLQAQAAVSENLAWMLEFHRRESKPVFWRLFDRLGKDHLDLEDDMDCLANCVRTKSPPYKHTPRARNLSYEYCFNTDQEFKPPHDDEASFYALGAPDNLKVKYLAEESRLDQGFIVVQSSLDPGNIITLIPDDFVSPAEIPEAIQDVAQDWANNTLALSAITDFLMRSKPRRGKLTGEPLVTSDQSGERLNQLIKAVQSLTNSYLAIQGPPGAGKSYTAARIIGALVKQGKRVGISSNSHKAINNLILGVARYCRDEGIEVHCCATKDTEAELQALDVHIITNKDLCDHVGQRCVLGATAWGFTRGEMKGQLDYLFIDEAGQVAVANLVGMSRSAKNLVLMGDQMQLGQPTQGTHPAQSGASVLDYLLRDEPIIDPALGVFLDTTYRMHPKVNEFISHAIYKGQLKADPANTHQVVKVPMNYKGPLDQEAGVLFVPVEHQGNTQASEEEVAEIVRLAKQLLGRTFISKNRKLHRISWFDILFVAPYNHQVSKLKQALGDKARVGSVDKFQGQEAPVVFFSLCCSDVSEAPRGIEFLFDKHRLNVAISRAQALAVVVGNPALFHTPVNSVENMARVNVLARLGVCSAMFEGLHQ